MSPLSATLSKIIKNGVSPSRGSDIHNLVLASDLGSGACKTILVDERARVVAHAHQEYATSYPRAGWAEQDPKDWYRAFCATVRAVITKSGVAPAHILGVAIVGVTHNAVLLDAKQQPLAPAILLFDARSSEQVEDIRKRWGNKVEQRTLNSVSTAWTWPQLAWIRKHQPEVWRNTASILFQKDYVRNRLASSMVTDHIDASGSLLYDPVEEAWIDEHLADLGLSESVLPELVRPTEVVGKVGAQGSADTGLMESTPVVAGTTDTAAEMVGSGGVRLGIATVKLASVGRIAVVTDHPLAARSIFNYRHLFDGMWYPGTASKYAGSAYRWLREVQWPELEGEDGYSVMDQAAAGAPAGSSGLLFHPHLNGQWSPYWDDNLRGAFLGITTRHTRSHLTRAVLEGVAFSLRDSMEDLVGLGTEIDSVRLIGRGSKSRIWAEIVADVLSRSLDVPDQVDAAYGAALIAAMGVGLVDPVPKAVEQLVEESNTGLHFEPDPERVQRYTELFGLYQDSVAPLRKLGKELFRFERTSIAGESPADSDLETGRPVEEAY